MNVNVNVVSNGEIQCVNSVQWGEQNTYREIHVTFNTKNFELLYSQSSEKTHVFAFAVEDQEGEIKVEIEWTNWSKLPIVYTDYDKDRFIIIARDRDAQPFSKVLYSKGD